VPGFTRFSAKVGEGCGVVPNMVSLQFVILRVVTNGKTVVELKWGRCQIAVRDNARFKCQSGF